MGIFKVKSVIDLNIVKVGDELPESDFVTTSPQTGKFIQFEYVSTEDKKHPYKVKPGIWSLSFEGDNLVLARTEFSKQNILESFIFTKEVTDKVDCFFNRLHIYKKHNIEVPHRGVLLYGPGGSGKSSSLKIIAQTYEKDQKTAIILWPTDKIDPYGVKEFIKTFEYEGVEKLILIAEDLGGVEVDEVKVKSYSSLLALLDNQEKAFRIPTAIIATTNHPEVFLGNIANRPGRFSDKIEIGYPKSDARSELFGFFLQDRKTSELLDLIKDKKYGEFTPAHLQEVIIRADLYDFTIEDSLNQVSKEIELYKKHFEKNKKKIGFDNEFDYE